MAKRGKQADKMVSKKSNVEKSVAKKNDTKKSSKEKVIAPTQQATPAAKGTQISGCHQLLKNSSIKPSIQTFIAEVESLFQLIYKFTSTKILIHKVYTI